MKSKLYIELHVRLENGSGSVEREGIAILPDLLMRLVAETRGGKFTGEEVRPAEVVFFLEAKNLLPVLPELRTIVERLGMLRDSFLQVRTDSLPSDSDLSIPLEDLKLWWQRLEQLTAAKPKKARRPRVNDFYAVPLPDGRFGHLQYVHHEPQWGDIVQVFSIITEGCPATIKDLVKDLDGAQLLFPPVITAVTVGIRVGNWIFLGNRPPSEQFRIPLFRSTISRLLRGEEPGVYDDWWLWSGGDTWQPVGKLNDEQRKLEYNVAWPPLDLARRIVTGENEYERFK